MYSKKSVLLKKCQKKSAKDFYKNLLQMLKKQKIREYYNTIFYQKMLTV
jgi:hypothetical protein